MSVLFWLVEQWQAVLPGIIAMAALWLGVWHGETRGYVRGRADMHREIFGRKKGMRL